MNAVILAAGIGSRLGTLTEQKPKCLVKVAGKPILQHQLDAFSAAGIAEVTVVTGYLSGEIERWAARHHKYNVTLIHNDAYEFTNNMYSARLALRDVVGDPFLLCNGDVVFDRDIIRGFIESAPETAIAVDLDSYDDEAMKVTVDDGVIDAISKEIPQDSAIGRSIDLYKFSADDGKALLAMCDAIIESEGDNTSWTEVALQRCFDAGTLAPLPFGIGDARWVEIDDLADLSLADRAFGAATLGDFEHVFIDLDGTLMIDGRAIAGAADFVAQALASADSVQLVSNNSSKTVEQYRAGLEGLGIDLDGITIVLSTEGLIHYLQTERIGRVFCVGTEALTCEIEAAGIQHTADSPDLVVVGYDLELTYDKLATAAKLINTGTPYVSTHADIACPTSDGPIPDAGAIVAALTATTGVEPVRVFGKPNASMLQHRIGDPSRSVMIGDRLYTDKALADACGIAFACVLSGETTRDDLQQLSEDAWPAMVADSVAGLAWDRSTDS